MEWKIFGLRVGKAVAETVIMVAFLVFLISGFALVLGHFTEQDSVVLAQEDTTAGHPIRSFFAYDTGYFPHIELSSDDFPISVPVRTCWTLREIRFNSAAAPEPSEGEVQEGELPEGQQEGELWDCGIWATCFAELFCAEMGEGEHFEECVMEVWVWFLDVCLQCWEPEMPCEIFCDCVVTVLEGLAPPEVLLAWCMECCPGGREGEGEPLKGGEHGAKIGPEGEPGTITRLMLELDAAAGPPYDYREFFTPVDPEIGRIKLCIAFEWNDVVTISLLTEPNTGALAVTYSNKEWCE